MPSVMTVTLEREIKLRFDTTEQARAAVLATGATPLRSRRLQEDCLLDTKDQTLRQRRCVLRIRIEAGKSRITFKGPVQHGSMKVRDECETVVGDGEALLCVFGELGFHPWFRYQKYREEYSYEDVIVAIDETPVGVYVELEGGERGIDRVAEALGRGPTDYVLDSYRGLFVKHCEECGRQATDMVFDES
jgi:adenylate cyclase class 2